jgi:alpha-tubulin suppressor-like RCC1 family protein
MVGAAALNLGLGNSHTCAVITGGAVRCWGSGARGQLGYANIANIGDTETPASAGDVMVGGPVTQLALGNAHTCALLTAGTVRCWGDNTTGVLGYANTQTIGDDETPAAAGDIAIGGKVTQLAYAGSHACARLEDGTVSCWGSGSDGQLGHGTTSGIGDNETPAAAGKVDVGGTVVKVATGTNHSCALLTGGGVRCWGNGTDGRLGYGNTTTIGDNELPLAAGTIDLGGTAIDIAAGGTHTCAILSDKTVRCWGDDRGFGLLGQGVVNNIGDDETPASAGDVAIP